MSDYNWWKDGVFYQIYPRSYMDKNNDGIGDLAGITEKLEYIAKLGVDGVWISPFFKSPMHDFGYDVSEYTTVDPIFGTNEDFDILLKCAHELGLKIIIDMVLSHTSIEHEWFNESRKDKTNDKADWYVWADAKPDGTPPNNWQSCFGGPAWTFDTKRGQYYMHNFLKEQPDLNFHNEDVQNALLGACEYWLERGVHGFRLDTVNFYFHDKELRDNPIRNPESISVGLQIETEVPYTMQAHIYDKSRPENIGFLKKLRTLMDKYPDTMTLGEIGDDNPYKLAVEYTDGDKLLHTTYNTHLISGTNAKDLQSDTITVPFKEFQNQPGEGWASWAFSNHDVVRSVTRWGKSIKDKEAFAILLNTLLLSLRGTPFIYQGEELGLPEAKVTFEQIQDPWGKYLWPEWVGRDGCRTPMPWVSDAPQAGFSEETQTWLPIPNEHTVRAVDVQESDANSVLNKTREFIAKRKEMPILQSGDIEFIETHDDKLLGFYRILGNEKILCLFNLSEEEKSYEGIALKPLQSYIEGT